MKLMYPLGGFMMLAGKLQRVRHLDFPDDQNLAVFSDRTLDLAGQIAFFQFRAARFQRSGKGAGESAPGRGHHVVERRRVWRKVLGTNAIVFGDLGMHAEHHRLVLGR